MLLHMQLEEFVILESAEIAFSDGLNVITGETGTGKSILCDAIGYLAGGRGEAGWMREGAEQMQVAGVFDVDRLPTAAAIATRHGCPPREGRLALTVYLTQTLMFTTLFYGYGFGQAFRLGPGAVSAWAVVIFAVQVVVCQWWSRRFRFGPMEWLWRSLTYLKWQPLRLRSDSMR